MKKVKMKKIIFGMMFLGIIFLVSENASGQRRCTPPADGITIFTETNYNGNCVNYAFGNIPDLGSMDNRVSSILVGPEINVILCTEVNFGGLCRTLTRSVGWLRNTNIGDNRLSSFRMVRKKAAPVKSDPYRSIYKKFNESNCRYIGETSINDIFECSSGIPGYKVTLVRGGEEDLGIEAPSGRNFALNTKSAISQYYPGKIDSINLAKGGTAEYRTNNRLYRSRTGGLIYRVNIKNNGRTYSNLVVVKLSPTRVCITNVVKPMKDQNVRARQLAERAVSAPCLN
jgi:hypothetical protein